MMTAEEIWNGDGTGERQADLFGRRKEAEQLIAYIESVAARRTLREDKRAFTLAVDARYGEGKSFFLRRLAEHLALNHPVAYIDAWSDDLADEPLTALAATLKTALEPFTRSQEVQSRIADFMTKTGKVAKIAGLGLLKRGAAMLITGAAVEAAEDAISGVSEEVGSALRDGIKDAAKGSVDDTAEGVKNVRARDLMEQRIASFEEGKLAVRSMKDSLAGIVAALEGFEQHPPIIIVIDELDRCRPTYAVKVLEEIKHLFDVPGLVFVLAVHAEQLAHSVAGAYGSGFDGRAYLKRFIDREYHLARPPLTPLVETLCTNAGLDLGPFSHPIMAVSQTENLDPTLPELIAEYMKVYGLGARDAFELVDILQTSAAISHGQKLHLPYLLPLAIGLMKGIRSGELPDPVNRTKWVYLPTWHRGSSDISEVGFHELAVSLLDKMTWTEEKISAAAQNARSDYVLRTVSGAKSRDPHGEDLTSIYGYPKLLGAVSRFKNPAIETEHVR